MLLLSNLKQYIGYRQLWVDEWPMSESLADTLAQNEASSVVWGMPGAAVELDAVMDFAHAHVFPNASKDVRAAGVELVRALYDVAGPQVESFLDDRISAHLLKEIYAALPSGSMPVAIKIK